MEKHEEVPSQVGPRAAWLAFLEKAWEWRRLVTDPDWNELIEERREPFGLFTTCPDQAKDAAAWDEFADHCVQRELRHTSSWGPNSRIVEDAFDDAYLIRYVNGLDPAEPSTASADTEPLENEFEVFLCGSGSDLRRLDADVPAVEWVRIGLVVGEKALLDQLRASIGQLRLER